MGPCSPLMFTVSKHPEGPKSQVGSILLEPYASMSPYTIETHSPHYVVFGSFGGQFAAAAKKEPQLQTTHSIPEVPPVAERPLKLFPYQPLASETFEQESSLVRENTLPAYFQSHMGYLQR